jgi:malate/lactate dehydrogenase
VERVLELRLTPEEDAQLKACAEKMKAFLSQVKQ